MAKKVTAKAQAEERSDLDLVIDWARAPTGQTVREDEVPPSVGAALANFRAEHPDSTVTLLALRSIVGDKVTQSGPAGDLPDDSTLTALSVVTTEVDASRVGVIAHTVVVSVAPTTAAKRQPARAARAKR
jgi:hypothetical protein